MYARELDLLDFNMDKLRVQETYCVQIPEQVAGICQ